MTKVLVTGGNGFIGHNLVRELVERGERVRVLDLRAPTRAMPGVQYVVGSVLNSGLVDECLRDVEQVYHLAGLPGMWIPRKSDFHAVNYGGTEIVVAAARRHDIARFLHCSTESILFHSSASRDIINEGTFPSAEEMPGLYTRSKMLAEQLAN